MIILILLVTVLNVVLNLLAFWQRHRMIRLKLTELSGEHTS